MHFFHAIYFHVSCGLLICIAVDMKHLKYSEEHPKRISECKNCQNESNYSMPKRKVNNFLWATTF